MNVRCAIILAAISALVLTAVAGADTTTGVIKGFVRDAKGQPVVYANVMLVGTTFGAMSLESGSFTIAQVPPGVYSVRAMMMGYEICMVDSVIVHAEGETQLSLRLKRLLRRPPYTVKDNEVPCTYKETGRSFVPPQKRHEGLTDEESNVLIAFYSEIVVPVIFPAAPPEWAPKSPLPVRITTWTELLRPNESFLAAIASDAMQTVAGTSPDHDAFLCDLTINRWTGRDTVEVQAALHYRDRGHRAFGRRALAIREGNGWKFCLNEGVFAGVGCGSIVP